MLVLIGAGQNNIPINTSEVRQYDYLVTSYKSAFKNYTLEEIEFVFNLAVQGSIDFEVKLYDKPFSVGFVGEMMKKYREWRKTNTSYQKSKQNPEAEKTEQEIYEQMKRGIINSFEEYKKGNPEEIKWYYFTWLERNEFLTFTTERKKEIYSQAKAELKEEFEAEKALTINPSEIKKLIESFNYESKAKNRAREISLKIFFDDLIETETNIIDILK